MEESIEEYEEHAQKEETFSWSKLIFTPTPENKEEDENNDILTYSSTSSTSLFFYFDQIQMNSKEKYEVISLETVSLFKKKNTSDCMSIISELSNENDEENDRENDEENAQRDDIDYLSSNDNLIFGYFNESFNLDNDIEKNCLKFIETKIKQTIPKTSTKKRKIGEIY